jgi:hypothetical protein
VTSIGYQAFYGCSSLKSIKIPKALTYIGSDAFPEHTQVIPEHTQVIRDNKTQAIRDNKKDRKQVNDILE